MNNFIHGFAAELVKQATSKLDEDKSIIPVLAALGAAAGGKWGLLRGLVQAPRGKVLKEMASGLGQGAIAGGALGAGGGAYMARKDIAKSLEGAGAI